MASWPCAHFGSIGLSQGLFTGKKPHCRIRSNGEILPSVWVILEKIAIIHRGWLEEQVANLDRRPMRDPAAVCWTGAGIYRRPDRPAPPNYRRRADPTVAERHPELSVEIAEAAEEMDLEYALEHLEGLTARARDGLGRIRRIVKDLRDFARLDEGEMDDADLKAGLVSTVEIVAGLARDHDIEIVTDLAPLPAVACSPGKINQVVLNLMINAVDASRPGGKVTLRARPHGSDGVTIDVIDEGVGIPPEIRGRIFDPFFTTKPVGQGTGLGLSISYGIVQDHGGRIDVESAPGEGSTFTVHLPLKPPARPRAARAAGRDGR